MEDEVLVRQRERAPRPQIEGQPGARGARVRPRATQDADEGVVELPRRAGQGQTLHVEQTLFRTVFFSSSASCRPWSRE